MADRRPERDAVLRDPAGAFGWFFRSRSTGEITIGQWPNAPLLLFVGCAVVGWFLDPAGGVGTGIRIVGGIALAYWSLDEIVRGVNPWRRCLGAAVLGGAAYSWFA